MTEASPALRTHTGTLIASIAVTAALVTLLLVVVFYATLVGGSAWLLLLLGIVFGGLAKSVAAVVLVAAAGIAAAWLIIWLGWRLHRRLSEMVQHRVLPWPQLVIAVLLGTALGLGAAYGLLKATVLESLTSDLMRDARAAAPLPVAELRKQEGAAMARKADAGDSLSQWRLALAYRNGDYGFPVDRPQAVMWMQKAVAQNDFDAVISQALSPAEWSHRRVAPDAGDARSASVETLLPQAPESRRASTELLLGLLSPSPSAEHPWLERAAQAGHAFAATELAQRMETRPGPKGVEHAKIYVLYGMADAPYDMDRMWRAMGEPDRAAAEAKLAATVRKALPAPDTQQLCRVLWRSKDQFTREVARPGTTASNADTLAHGLTAVLNTGFAPAPDPRVEQYFAQSSASARLYHFQRAMRDDCSSMSKMGEFARKASGDPADFAWSAAFYQLAMQCAQKAEQPDLQKQAQAGHDEASSLILSSDYKAVIEERLAKLQAIRARYAAEKPDAAGSATRCE